MRIAYFSPLPPQRSGISDYSVDLLYHLREKVDIVLWVDGIRPDARLTRDFKVVNYGGRSLRPSSLDGYDLALYHIGNNHVYHSGILRAFEQHPGLAVLHDYSLRDLFIGPLLAGGDREGLTRLLISEYDAEGERLASEIISGSGIDGLDPLAYPFNSSVVDKALGVIVHSGFARGLLRKRNVRVPVRQIPFGTAEPRHMAPPPIQDYGIPRDRILIGCFGFVIPSKRLPTAFEALAVSPVRSKILMLVVGKDSVGIDQFIERDGLGDFVRHIDFVPADTFEALIEACDICLNLRFPTMGETSGSLCRIMARGKPAVVSNVGWYSELPDGSVVKIDVGPNERIDLRRAVERLVGDSGCRNEIGRRAKAYIRSTHSWAQAAHDYVEFAQDLISGRAETQMNLANEIGAALHDMGVTPADRNLIGAIAQAGESLTHPIQCLSLSRSNKSRWSRDTSRENRKENL